MCSTRDSRRPAFRLAYLAGLGPDVLKAHFASEAAKRYARHGNTLEAAAYQAASVNDAFCAGEYRN